MKIWVKLNFKFYEYYDFFCLFMYVLTLNPCDSDVGPERPDGMSPIAR